MKKERSSSSHRFKYGEEEVDDQEITLQIIEACPITEE
jgi:hypothetical protein